MTLKLDQCRYGAQGGENSTRACPCAKPSAVQPSSKGILTPSYRSWAGLLAAPAPPSLQAARPGAAEPEHGAEPRPPAQRQAGERVSRTQQSEQPGTRSPHRPGQNQNRPSKGICNLHSQGHLRPPRMSEGISEAPRLRLPHRWVRAPAPRPPAQLQMPMPPGCPAAITPHWAPGCPSNAHLYLGLQHPHWGQLR